jgi:protein involved in polysaccharide export with SLBB domain
MLQAGVRAKQFGVGLVLVSFFVESSIAQAPTRGEFNQSFNLENARQLPVPQSGAEYVSDPNASRALSMPVQVVGAVQKPGIHYVPLQSDLLQVMALAGGPAADAELSEIHVRRRTGSSDEVLNIKGKTLFQDATAVPLVRANDTIYIEHYKPLIGNNTVQVLTVVSTLLSIAVGAVALIKTKK